MLAVVFKLLLFYFLFVFIRWSWRVYKSIQIIKVKMERMKSHPSNLKGRKKDQKGTQEAFDAEYRVIDKDE